MPAQQLNLAALQIALATAATAESDVEKSDLAAVEAIFHLLDHVGITAYDLCAIAAPPDHVATILLPGPKTNAPYPHQ